MWCSRGLWCLVLLLCFLFSTCVDRVSILLGGRYLGARFLSDHPHVVKAARTWRVFSLSFSPFRFLAFFPLRTLAFSSTSPLIWRAHGHPSHRVACKGVAGHCRPMVLGLSPLGGEARNGGRRTRPLALGNSERNGAESLVIVVHALFCLTACLLRIEDPLWFEIATRLLMSLQPPPPAPVALSLAALLMLCLIPLLFAALVYKCWSCGLCFSPPLPGLAARARKSNP